MSISSHWQLTSIANVIRILSDVVCKTTEELKVAVWFGMLLLHILNSLTIIVPAAPFFVR